MPPIQATIPEVGSQQAHPSEPVAPVDISIESTPIIDRLLAAKPKHFDQHTLDELRRWVHGYQAKFATEPNPHPPDPFLLAQLLTIAPLDQLIRLIQDLMCERKQPGYSYAWFVSVALQRIHGIAPQAFKTRRAQLKIVKSGSPPPPAQDGMQFASDLVSQVSARIGRPGR